MENKNENVQNQEKLTTKEFEVKVISRKKKDSEETFNVYQALTKSGRWMDLKFTKDVPENERPVHGCRISVKAENMSVDRTLKFPVCWVSKIEAILEFDKKQDVSDYFD